MRWKITKNHFGLWHFIQNFDWCKTIAYWFYNVDGYIKVYDGTRYLVLFDPEKHDAI